MSRKNQRQLKHSRLRSFAIRNLVIEKNGEGVTSETFPLAGDPITVKGEIWPATSKRQVEMYGDRLNGISNFRVVGQYSAGIFDGASGIQLPDNSVIRIGDGVYVLADPMTDEPDYRIISVTPYQPVKMEIEKR